MNLSARTWCWVLLGLSWGTGGAAPLADPQDRQQVQATAPAEPAESPVDVQAWIQRESTVALLDGAFEADRRAVLRQGWQGRPPTWIQDSVTVNLGDFPTLDNSTERAERDLKTLEWVIEEQRRLAAGQAVRAASPYGAAPDDDNWVRRLIPTHWVATLKANREWVAAGGTALMVIVWGTTMFARRPSAVAPPMTPPPAPPPRRRRRRFRDSASAAG